MPIDRGPWNTLVDDDGSNLVGSIWNKAAIQTVLLDPIDAFGGVWTPVPHYAPNYTATTGTWTVTAANQALYHYIILNSKTAVVQIVVTNSTLSAATTRLNIVLPAAVQGHAGGAYFAQFFAAGGATGTGLGSTGPTSLDLVRDLGGTPFGAGAGCYIYLTAIFNLP